MVSFIKICNEIELDGLRNFIEHGGCLLPSIWLCHLPLKIVFISLISEIGECYNLITVSDWTSNSGITLCYNEFNTGTCM